MGKPKEGPGLMDVLQVIVAPVWAMVLATALGLMLLARKWGRNNV